MATVLDHFITLFEYKTTGLDALGRKAAKAKAIGRNLTVGLTLPLLAVGAASVKAASDLDESLSKSIAVFGESSKAIDQWANNSVNSMGKSRREAIEGAATFGNMAVSMGFTQEQAVGMSTTLAQLGADIGSLNNVRASIADTSLTSIFTGEQEALKKFGPVMTEFNLKQFAMAEGTSTNIQKLTQMEKVMLRYRFVLAKTKTAQGDFVRTSDQLANSAKIMRANLENLAATFGTELVPQVTKAIIAISDTLSGLNKWWTDLSGGAKEFVVGLGAVIAIAGPLTVAISGIAAALATVSAAGGPVFLVIGLIAAAVVGVIALVSWLGRLGKEASEVRVGGVTASAQPAALKAASQTAALGGGRTYHDNRTVNVNSKVDVKEASDGRQLASQFNRQLRQDYRNVAQNFEMLEV